MGTGSREREARVNWLENSCQGGCELEVQGEGGRNCEFPVHPSSKAML